jgi:hypothetical protein
MGPRGASLPSARTVDTRHSAKSLSPSSGVVMTSFLRRERGGTRQSLCRMPDKKYLANKSLPIYSSPSVTLGKDFAECFFQALLSALDTRETDVSGSVESYI